MTREEAIRLAKEVDAYRYVNRAAKDEPTHTFTVEKLERFAELVAAEYKKDAERYRWMRENKFKHNGHCMALSGPILWEELLDDAIDAAMEKVK